jgi:predicted membrane protein
MENVFFTSEPIIILILTIITVSLIVVGRKMELPQLPIIVVIYSLTFLIYHTIGVNKTTDSTAPYYFSIAVDLVMLFLGFITYLWVDDIEAKSKNKKSYSDELDWFWDKL